jgi:hypothetical protein
MLTTLPYGTPGASFENSEDLKKLSSKASQIRSNIELSHLEKVEQLKQLEEDYKPLVRQYAPQKPSRDLYILSLVLEAIGDLLVSIADEYKAHEEAATTKSSPQTSPIGYYTDAVMHYRYAISILATDQIPSIDSTITNQNRIEILHKKITVAKLDFLEIINSPGVKLVEDLDNVITAEIIRTTSSDKEILSALRSDVEKRITIINELDPRSEEYILETRTLFHEIATRMKKFIAQIFLESEAEIGEAPCQYAVIGLGSLALEQATPYSDLEFAIITQNQDYTLNPDPKVRDYFKNLAHSVNFRIINLGETTIPKSRYGIELDHLVYPGIMFDLGGKTALGRVDGNKPYDLVQTIEGMMLYVKNEGDRAEHIDKNLPNILLQTTHIYGEKALTDSYQGRVTEFLHSTNEQGRKQYEARSIKLLKEGAVEIDYMKSGTKSRHSGDLDRLTPLDSEDYMKHGRLFDVKQEIYRLPDRLLYNLGLCYGLQSDNIIEIANLLFCEGIINIEASNNLKYAATFASMLRLQTYIHHKGQIEDISLFSESSLAQEELAKAFHLQQKDMIEGGGLFRYYYTALPLYEKLQAFCDKYEKLNAEEIKAFFKDQKLYDETDSTNGLVYFRLLNYSSARSNFEKILDLESYACNPKIMKALIFIYSTFIETEKVRQIFDGYVKYYLGSSSNLQLTDEQCKALLSFFGEYTEAILFFFKKMGIIDHNQGDGEALDRDIFKYCTMSLKPEDSFADFIFYLCQSYILKTYDARVSNCLAESLDQAQEVYKDTPNHKIAAYCLILGTRARELKNYQDAKKYLLYSLEIEDTIHNHEPNLNSAKCLEMLYGILYFEGNIEQAIKYSIKNIEIRKSLYQNSPDIAYNFMVLGSLYLEQNKYTEAVKACYESFIIISQFENHAFIPIITKYLFNTALLKFSTYYALNYEKMCNKILVSLAENQQFANAKCNS